MSQPELGPCPPRFAEIKLHIASSYPDFESRATKAWIDLLGELDKETEEIASQGSDVCILPPAVRQTTDN